MRSAKISFKNKNIVIVGGGKQAAKKVKLFLEEGANVSVIAPSFEKSIPKELCIKKCYEKKDIMQAFMVYACTDDRELNHQIVLDANEIQCLSANVQTDEEATYRPLYSVDYEHMHLAISTNGAFPSLLKKMSEEFGEIYNKVYHDHLENLRYIREYFLSMNYSLDERSIFLKELATLSKAQVKFYKEAIENQKVIVFVFHGNDDAESIKMIENMIEEIEKAAYYAFIHEKTKTSLAIIQKHLSLLAIKDVLYQPMFLTKGYCYKKVCSQLSNVEELLLNDKNIHEVLKSYCDCRQGLIVVHDAKENVFCNMIKKLLPSHVKVISLTDSIPEFKKEDEILLSGMFVLKGKHFRNDVLDDIYKNLVDKGYDVEKNEKTLLETKAFKEIIFDKFNLQ